MNSDSNKLVSLTYPPLTGASGPLTAANFDTNMLNIYKDLEDLCVTSNVPNYDASTTYNNDYTDSTSEHFAMHGGRLWMWVNATPNSGVTPVAGASWQEIFPVVLVHEKNKDQHLTPVSLTHAAAVSLAASNGLVAGAPYQISDKDISVTASTTGSFCPLGCRKMRIVKDIYYTASGTNLGVWNSALTPTAGDIAVWGGKVWRNVSGAVGTATASNALSADWTVQSTTSNTYYQTKAFAVLYDFANDWVSRQFDDRGNVFGIEYQSGALWNIVDISDWGNSSIYRNVCEGVYNNSNGNDIAYNRINGYIGENSNSGTIYRNTCSTIFNNSNNGYINDNSNNGTINANSNNGDIEFNINNGAISSNSNGNLISLNSNNGEISSNANTGVISVNSNNGSISTIGAANVDIRNNVNNGLIGTTTTGNITDVIVNK